VIKELTTKEEELTIDIEILTTIIEQQKEEIARLKAAPKARSGVSAPESPAVEPTLDGEGQPLVGSPHFSPSMGTTRKAEEE
jgi:hypothetical protein